MDNTQSMIKIFFIFDPRKLSIGLEKIKLRERIWLRDSTQVETRAIAE